MIRTSWSVGAAVIFTLFAVTCYGRGSAKLHANDFFDVINGYNDQGLRTFYEKFSSDIDDNKDAEHSSSVSARIKRRIAAKSGRTIKDIHFSAHRYIAHQWPYNGSIPGSDLLILEYKFPGCKEDIREIWGAFCRENNEAIAREFRWQQAPHLAKAYCAVLYYTHLLADWLPPPVNKGDYQYLMPVNRIVAELQRAVESMGRSDSHKKYCEEFRKKMGAALAANPSPSKQAELVLEALKSMKLGTMLHERFGLHGQMDEAKHPYREESQQPQLQKAA